ncbi:MAG: hypothetical protein PWP48_703 [Clostridiales bacterium]|nr:hypothetical protein [Clostridiales bacterium]MDK2991470.1 hypothetical protein [Clostridiales bacterium]
MRKKKLKIMSVFGTRPEAVKMAPLIKEMGRHPDYIENIVCITAQHREMLDQVLRLFDIKPAFDLNIMQDRQTLADITVRALQGLYDLYGRTNPDLVLVHGDTTTTFAASLAAFYRHIAVGHVEAGLRTHDKYFPFPEEINRKLTAALADLHFAPTAAAKKNLIKENISVDNIFVTGNTVIDALLTTVKDEYEFQTPQLQRLDFKNQRILVVTAHRRENIGAPLENICLALKEIVEKYGDVHIIYPVHLNPSVRDAVFSMLGNIKRIMLLDPLDTEELHNLMARCYLVLTDSGGLQEEAPSLGKPVLVLRDVTERPEAVEAGTVKIIGTDVDAITKETSRLLDDADEYKRMANAINPYGDGHASERIVQAILYKFNICNDRPLEFLQ